jgi:hypothetical protein
MVAPPRAARAGLGTLRLRSGPTGAERPFEPIRYDPDSKITIQGPWVRLQGVLLSTRKEPGHAVRSAPSCRARARLDRVGRCQRGIDLHRPARALDAVGPLTDMATFIDRRISATGWKTGSERADASLSRCVVAGGRVIRRSGARGDRSRGSAPSSRWERRRRSCGGRMRGRSAGDPAHDRSPGTRWTACRSRCSVRSRRGPLGQDRRADGDWTDGDGSQMAAVRAPMGMRRSSSIWRSSSAERPSVVR